MWSSSRLERSRVTIQGCSRPYLLQDFGQILHTSKQIERNPEGNDYMHDLRF